MRLLFCGDIMPGGVLPYQESYMDDGMSDFLSQFDFRIGTLECAVGNGLPFDEEKMRRKMNIIYVRNEDLFRVREMGFDVVSLANNHVWDMGAEGLRNTMHQLERLGIQYCGAGMNIEEASKPAVVEKDGTTVAFLAYCMCDESLFGHIEIAEKDKPGLNPLFIDKVVADVKAAKKRYDKVVVIPHWGKEYEFVPMPEIVDMAKQMIKAGADAIMGGHPHLVQPFVRLHGVPVCFCLGNFLFPDFYMQPPRPMWYPDMSENLAQIPDIHRYIFPVKERVRRVWQPQSRYSRVVALNIAGKKMGATSYFTHLEDENVIRLSSITKYMKQRLWKASFAVKCGLVGAISTKMNRLKHHVGR